MMAHHSGRRSRGRLWLLALAAILACGVIWGITTAAGASSSPSPSAAKIVLKVGNTQDVDSLNPFIGYSVPAYEVYHLNYDMLTGYKPNGDVAPEIADSWSNTPDFLTWTFKIHPGINWQDGVPLTAKDVAFTYNYIIQNDLSAFSTYTVNMKKAVAVDDTTVKFYLTKPKANILRMWIPIVPEHIWSKISGKAASNSFQNNPPIIGSGPFQTVEFKKSGFTRMVAYKGYWKGAPKIDELIFENYTNQDTMTMDLKAGNLDVAFGVPVAQFNALKSEPGIKAQAADQKYLVELAFNAYASPNSQANPVLQDIKFRQAVSWAVDKSKIVATCMGGYADVGQSVLVPSTDDAWTPTDTEKFAYDPEKAKQLLDAAGYKDSNGDGVREDKQGKPIKLRLWTRSESPEQQRAGKLIAGSFESIGIGIELAVMNDGSISDGIWTYKGSTYAPNYDLFIWGWSGNIDPDYMLADFITSQIEMWNDCCWSDKQYDSLYQQQASEMDAAKRKDQVTQMQQIFYQQAPYAVLYYPKALIAYNTAKWEGWVPYPSSNGLVVLSGDNIDSYRLVHPVVATADSTSKSSSTTYIVIGVIVAIIVILLVVVLVRRGRGRELTE
jgi:peptide/nickel transport system substrate-binding protein